MKAYASVAVTSLYMQINWRYHKMKIMTTYLKWEMFP